MESLKSANIGSAQITYGKKATVNSLSLTAGQIHLWPSVFKRFTSNELFLVPLKLQPKLCT